MRAMPSAFARRRRVVLQLSSWLAHGKPRHVRQYFALRRSFSYGKYLAANRDVAAAGLHPLLHYIEHGAREGRRREPPPRRVEPRPRRVGPPPISTNTADEVRRSVQPGPEFEEFDPQIAAEAPPRAKVLAYYLPQFHSIPENDEWWGEGFTEWSNVARGAPRFVGHYQPRVPRDLGFYDLGNPETLARQIDLARAAGIFGFSFYYYWFDGKRLLERPVERFLADSSLDFPFCLMWANENWTRRWDGQHEEILIAQTYDPSQDAALVDDLQRHFADPRYIRLEGRPLLLLYRVDCIPDAADRIERWRELWRLRHGEEPLIFMAQAFGTTDPRTFGFDGAFEFPPHKVTVGLPEANSELTILDPAFRGRVLAYEDVVAAALAEPVAEYPLVRTATPSWDNDARRQGALHQVTMLESTPATYERWLRALADAAAEQPIFGEPLVFVNAWNEWAEAAYLEPDLYFGAAYLNATARALCAPPPVEELKGAVRPIPTRETPADEDPTGRRDVDS
jgi:lipopolysaccharide biosynthesis protein